MKTNTLWKSFLNKEQTLALSHTYKNGVYYHLMLTITNPIIAEHIKDICIEKIHPLLESLSHDTIHISDIEHLVEHSLQEVNHSFSLFAEQDDQPDHINLNGALVISYQGHILVSLIGDSSLMICRNGKKIYNIANTDSNQKGGISHFTDYVSGAIHTGDSVLILGFDHSSVLHHTELHKIAQLIYDNEPDMLSDLEAMIKHRIEEQQIGYISLVRNISQTLDFSGLKGNRTHQRLLNYLPKGLLQKWGSQTQSLRTNNSYPITLGVLIVAVIGSMYSIINNAINQSLNTPQITTETGVEVVTIEDIKKEIATFLSMDVTTSNEKGVKYKEINDKLEFLKSQGRWIEDVTALQKILQDKYYEGFNIIAINDLNDITGEFKSIYPFSDTETKILGTPLNIFYEKGFFIAGTKGAVVKGINQDVKGTPVSYALASDIRKCTLDLPKNGLYCFDSKNELYRITAGSVTPISSATVTLPTDIQDIGTFGKNNIYLMINPQTNGGSDLIRRYTIQPGNYASLGTSLGYKYAIASGDTTAFRTMTIDGNFLSRSSADKKVYQFQRDPATNNLNSRVINLQGGDSTFVTYSENVKVITSANSRYVYLFDKDNQTFTVYTSAPSKTIQGNELKYNLTYIMRYSFDKSLSVLDVTIPANNNPTQPILYVLTANGIFEANLGNTIKLYEN